ncbi:FtsX-like permease family protein [Chloroflexia bacterium SDU3-3]|nr:FtsX-like permease family protein [Chloroflexia bacterium SDU3-3]
MQILESFRIALAALSSNKLRAVLTMFGIIIGVGAVVGILSIGNGLSDYFNAQFQQMGVGIFYITPSQPSAADDAGLKVELNADDAYAIMSSGAVPAVRSVVIEYSGNALVSAGGDRYYYPVKGVTPNSFTVSDNTLGAGRYYTDAEEQARARVAVIGADVATALYGGYDAAVGQRISLNGSSFEVVGVLTTESSQMSFNTPKETVFLPYATARERLFRNQVNRRVDVGQLTVQAVDKSQVNDAIDQVTALLRERHRLTGELNNFSVDNPEQQAQQAQASILALNGFLGVIAGISLLVGGIGIMNIMLVSVTQRTREIGLRKAVGARSWDILMQFLIEALTLCLIGGLLGVGCGYLMSFAGTYVLQNIFMAKDSAASVSMSSVVLATAVAGAIGVGFGFFPALRASRLNPIQALRND